jgi:hypothetical protein
MTAIDIAPSDGLTANRVGRTGRRCAQASQAEAPSSTPARPIKVDAQSSQSCAASGRGTPRLRPRST